MQPPKRSHTAKNTLDVFAGWLLDGTGSPVRTRVLMGVTGGTIHRIRAIKEGEVPEADLDLSAYTLIPALVDSHVHLFMSGDVNPRRREFQLKAPFQQVCPVISRHLEQHLAGGIVAVRDGGDWAGHALRYREHHQDPENLPIRMKSAGKAWRAPGRYGSLIGRPPRAGECLAEGVKRVGAAVDHVKIVNSGLNSLQHFGLETRPQFSRESLRSAVESAERMGRKTMVHANGRVAVADALAAGCHSVEHGFFMGEENLRRMSDLEVTWVPTACTMKGYADLFAPGSNASRVARETLAHQLAQMAGARDLGVTIAVGSDSGSPSNHHGSGCAEEITLLMQAGFSLPEAVRCATLNGSRLLGVEEEAGCLRPGMPATFLAVPGGPAELPEALAGAVNLYIRGKAWTGKGLEEKSTISQPLKEAGKPWTAP